jgi:hypothetical protein
VMQGGPLSESRDDDDEQIVQYLRHVRGACLVLLVCLHDLISSFHFRLSI